jgi:hypothetical protein
VFRRLGRNNRGINPVIRKKFLNSWEPCLVACDRFWRGRNLNKIWIGTSGNKEATRPSCHSHEGKLKATPNLSGDNDKDPQPVAVKEEQ